MRASLQQGGWPVKAKKTALRALGLLLLASMAATVGLLLAEGRWKEAVPLHLCSISSIVCVAAAFDHRQFFLDFLWYLGMPGAALALVFPAPALCRRQMLLDVSYTLTHALILVIPACLIAFGMRPGTGKTARMLLALLGIAALAGAANRLLGTNFLFLAAPAAGTPLEWIHALGRAPYLLTLFLLMALLCAAMDRLAGRIRMRQ